MESSDLDSLLSADIHDTEVRPTGNVNESVPDKIVVVSDDDDDDADVDEVVEINTQKVEKYICYYFIDNLVNEIRKFLDHF